MEITETCHARSREEWRAWLEAHHGNRREIWLVSHLVATGRPSIAYNDAVEEALCFGWIDSTRKTLDADRFAQRYTPRRPGSPYSQLNLERLARLLDAGRVAPAVAAALDAPRAEDFVVPADIEDAIRSDPAAWRHWSSFSAPYRRIRAAYVESARERDLEVFEKRLAHLVKKTAAGKQFGYGIEAFY